MIHKMSNFVWKNANKYVRNLQNIHTKNKHFEDTAEPGSFTGKTFRTRFYFTESKNVGKLSVFTSKITS